jgi:hypothetical protein
MNISTNAVCSSVITMAAGVVSSWASTTSNGIFPYQVSPYGAGQGSGAFGAGVTLTVNSTIGKTTDGLTSHPVFTQCRVYVPKYEMSPVWDELYFTKNSLKTIMYNDYVTPATITALLPGSAVTGYSLTQSVSRGRYILIYPFQSASTHPSSATLFSSPLLSPFSAAPCQSCPFGFLTQLQVYYGGKPLFESPLNYRYEHYINNIRTANSVNGGQIMGSSSGLLSYDDWQLSPIYFIDLSRYVSDADDISSEGITLNFTNGCNKTLDLMFIVGSQRIETIDCSLGVVVREM